MMRLLLVDDEEKFVKTLTKRLCLRGIEAECVFGGEEALRRVAAQEYDVVLLDVKMPGIGGLEQFGDLLGRQRGEPAPAGCQLTRLVRDREIG